MPAVNRRTFMKVGVAGAAGLRLAGRAAQGQAIVAPKKLAPVGEDDKPILRLEASGPTTFVTSLAFSPDGATLYAAGFDKVVRVWKLQDGKFVLDKAAYRVPIGPGLMGAINAIALSDDGAWLAAAGRGVMRGEADFRVEGTVVPRSSGVSKEMALDQGTVFVFNTKKPQLRRLRGHLGPIQSLAFLPHREGKPTLLVSTAQEREGTKKYGGVRVWNVESGQEIASRLDLPGKGARAGVAAWHTGERLKQLQVGLAWDDGILRLWDVETNAFLEANDGKYNLTIARLPGQGKLLTGSIRGETGQLQVWNAPLGRALRPDPAARVLFSKTGNHVLFPRALTLVSLKGDGNLDHAAVVFRSPGKVDRYELDLVDLQDFGTVKTRILLWTSGPNLPVLAAVRKGQFLAVAGNDGHEIHVFRIDELLKDEPRVQILRGSGTSFREVTFVANAQNDPGLRLRIEGRKEDLIFDFQKRSLLSGPGGWKSASASGGAWSSKVVAAEKDTTGETVRQAISIRQNDQEKQRIDLKKLHQVTTQAVLPPLQKGQPSILALAFLDENRQPWLYLYNAATGEKFRELTGHTDAINSLAFSADGRLLASAAADQTVCVWSLTNLDKILGRRGMIHGLPVRWVDGNLVVGEVDKESSAGNELKEGDVLEGIIEGDRVRPFKDLIDYYHAVSQTKPGQAVSLQVKGKGRVRFQVGQFVDERKPLFSFFITKPAKAGSREWVGWSPEGQFDASDRKTERLIGWHFNRGREADSPPAFAHAEQYRQEYYKEGILKHLVATGRLSDALKSWDREDKGKPLPKPKMVFWIDEAGSEIVGPDPRKRNDLGQFVVQKPQANLKLAICDFPLPKIDDLQWGLLGEKPQTFPEVVGLEWSASLAPLLTKPGLYKVRISLRTAEAEPQEHVEDLTLRFQLPAQKVQRNPAQPLPTLVLTSPPSGTLYYEEEGKGPPEVEIQGELQVPKNPPDFKTVVRIQNADNDKEEVTLAPTVQGQRLTAKIPLKYRDNRVQVLFSNQGNAEVVAGELRLRYLRPPRITHVEAPKESAKPLVDLVATANSPLEITPQSVEAEVNGREIAWNQIKLDKQPDSSWKIQIKDVPLSPGKNTVNLWVGNAEAKSRFPGVREIFFQPPRPIPEVEFLNPAVDTKVTEPTLDLRFRVRSATPLQRVELIRDGRPTIRKAFDVAGRQANAQGDYVFEEKNHPLVAKENLFRVEAINDGGAQHASLVVNYLQVPVRLTIDRLVFPNKKLEPIRPVVKAENALYIPTLPSGTVRLEGHVTWGKEDDEQLRKLEMVKVFVNGFQQAPGWLEEAKGKARERPFTADILLNRSDSNVIELQLPSVKQEEGHHREFTVACREPVTGQRLHLLIVGVDETNEERLMAQAFTALRANNVQGQITTPAFESVRVYGPLTGYVSPGQVFYQLCLIKKTIDLHARQGSTNDVVMVYYQGQETVNLQGHFFATSAIKYDPRLQSSAITCDGLFTYFASTLGAQILLLDVMRTAGPALAPGEAVDRIAKWPDSTYTGVMRYLKRIQAGQVAKQVLLTDLSEVMPKAIEWGDVLAEVKNKVDGQNHGAREKLLTLDENFRAPLRRLVVGKKI